jgi:hypothetical protein
MQSPSSAPRRRAPGVLLHRLTSTLDNLVERGIARRVDSELVELRIASEEMTEGGMITIRMHVPVPCESCDTAGCGGCGWSGMVPELYSAWLALPPDAPDGTILRPSAFLPGMRPVAFRVRRA